MTIAEEYWADTQQERQENDIQVPYMAKEFMHWLECKGYKASTSNVYVTHLLDLDKLVNTKLMPVIDVYEEIHSAYVANDTSKLRNLCKEHEAYLTTYLSILKGGIDIETRISAEYDDIRKYRSVWRIYSCFLYSSLSGAAEETPMVNTCIIPLKDEFIEYIKSTSGKNASTARTYICRLRTMNDKYLSMAFPEEQLPFHATNSAPRIPETIDILNTCIAHIGDCIEMEENARTIQKLKDYASASRLYRDFLQIQSQM